MKITLNISPCPNDTFMFDALIHKRIDMLGYEFEFNMLDIEQLNTNVQSQGVDVSKISYALYPTIMDKYQILNSGSAIGRGNGPLLVSRKKIYPDELHDTKIGIPGKMTTANMLLDRVYPKATNKREYLFSDISTAVMDMEIDCGILIHEERFTYKQKGLQLIADLGQKWEDLTGKMIPLGTIVIRRVLSQKVKLDIERLIKNSIVYANQNPKISRSFVKNNARELDNSTIDQHIEMFVNKYSLDITSEGKDAIYELYSTLDKNKLKDIFL